MGGSGRRVWNFMIQTQPDPPSKKNFVTQPNPPCLKKPAKLGQVSFDGLATHLYFLQFTGPFGLNLLLLKLKTENTVAE